SKGVPVSFRRAKIVRGVVVVGLWGAGKSRLAAAVRGPRQCGALLRHGAGRRSIRRAPQRLLLSTRSLAAYTGAADGRAGTRRRIRSTSMTSTMSMTSTATTVEPHIRVIKAGEGTGQTAQTAGILRREFVAQQGVW